MEDNDYPKRLRTVEAHMASCETRWVHCHDKHGSLEKNLAELEKMCKDTQAQMQRLLGAMAVAVPVLSFIGTILAGWISNVLTKR